MRSTTLWMCLLAGVARAADLDGGAADAGRPAAPHVAADAGPRGDAGHPAADAGLTGEAAALPWKAKPVLLFAEAEDAFEKYITAKPSERAAVKGLLTKLTVGKRTAAMIVVDGYELPYSRRVDISADIVITAPDGREVLDKASLAGARTMDPKTMIALPLKPVFGLMFGLTDLEGEYKVRVTIWDHVRGASSLLETKFTVSR